VRVGGSEWVGGFRSEDKPAVFIWDGGRGSVLDFFGLWKFFEWNF